MLHFEIRVVAYYNDHNSERESVINQNFNILRATYIFKVYVIYSEKLHIFIDEKVFLHI